MAPFAKGARRFGAGRLVSGPTRPPRRRDNGSQIARKSSVLQELRVCRELNFALP